MASFSVPCPKCSAFASSCSRQRNLQQQQQLKVSFSLSANPRHSVIGGSSLDQPLLLRFQGSKRKQSTVWKAQVNEVAVEKSSNATLVSPTSFEALSSDAKDIEPTKEPGFSDVPISAFMSEVASLVKLVDSRDIMELKLKQLDCELIIRKKEAFPQSVATAPAFMIQPPSASTILPSQPPSANPAATPAASAPPALPAPSKLSKSSHPALKCPMAGTYYRCPAPGEPPFVKVGDKVQKGQVICIIEAMKLMNEIEADQSGTIVEVLAEDGKPVSIDMPLFIIEP